MLFLWFYMPSSCVVFHITPTHSSCSV
jgi:hypothetical protein